MTRSLVAAAAVMLAMFVAVPPIAQDPAYHSFADQRQFFGIPNFWNVVSNAAFLLVGMYGLMSARRNGWAYRIAAIGTAAVAFGSGYYHLHPSNETLFWDRLPMTLVFSSLVSAAVDDLADRKLGSQLLAPLLAVGISSVIVWRMSGDLRLYALVQFGSITAVVAVLLFAAKSTPFARSMWSCVLLYAAAKILEAEDAYAGTHAWKHLVAAAAVLLYIRTGVRRDRNVTIDAPETDIPAIK